jgi:hypothetical protein
MEGITCTENTGEYLQINIPEDKFINDRVKWCGHPSNMNKDQAPSKILTMKLQGKHSRLRQRSRCQ